MKKEFLLGIAKLLRCYAGPGKTLLWRYLQRGLNVSSDEWVTVSFPEGFRFRANLREHWQRQMIAGCYDRREYAFIKNLLAPGDVFFDVGANAGYYTLMAAARVLPGGQVHAFEPHPAIAAQLQENAALNPDFKILVCRKAFSDKEGRSEFFLPPDNGWQSVEGSLQRLPGFSPVTVETQTLDGYVSEAGLKKIRLAKIDVEEAEPAVLDGARHSLSSGVLESVICEVSDGTKNEVFSRLKVYGFEQAVDLRNSNSVTVETLRPGLCNVAWLRGECFKRWNRK